MKIVFLGPPGAGKGTQAQAIVDAFSIPQISTGDIFRATQKENSPLGEKLRAQMGSGKLVDDQTVNEMVAARLAQPDCQAGFLLDGYPRTLPQAEVLDRLLERQGSPLNHVLLLQVDDALLVRRITGRRQDPETGRIYHVETDPAPPEIRERLIQRADDTEAVLSQRLREYHEKTAPLVTYYEGQGLLRRIDASGKPAQVEQQVLALLRG